MWPDMPKILFSLGKGGVGKSTVSSLTAVHLARQNKKVVLTSLDPAHNLSDIFEIEFSDKAKGVIDGLQIIEINQDKWIKKYLKESEQQFSKAYSYLTTFSLEDNFSVMQYAPGIEEYALLLAFYQIVEKYKNVDHLLFDMPPTALTLKFFALPQLSLLWLEKLLALRKEIAKKQKIISTLKLGRESLERDRVMQNIESQIAFWSGLNTIFLNAKKTFPLLVQNPDKLSQKEGARIIEKMKSLKMPDVHRILNKSKSAEAQNYLTVIPPNSNLSGLDNLIAAESKIDYTPLLQMISA
jgi:arsenite/tail-anchored protein-transporting ATPase